MSIKRIFPTLFLVCISCIAFSQKLIVEGYAFEDNNRGYLNEVDIKIFTGNRIVATGMTDQDGKFVLEVPLDGEYEVVARKRVFNEKRIPFSTVGKTINDKVYLKVPMSRMPGYLFEATIAELLDKRILDAPADGMSKVKVEIYNNTTHKEELVIDTTEAHTFSFTFEQGNHYTIMLRKDGYFTKRIEANVNVNGCILCFEGIGTIRPGVTDNLTENNTVGTLGANINMQKIIVDKSYKIDNIYYDYNKWFIREDAKDPLKKVLRMLWDNPEVSIELSSHTDSRGDDDYNSKLSQKRAQAAVNYIVSNGVWKRRITAKGYGEEMLVNECENGIDCTEEEHQENRRTEFKVTDYKKDPTSPKSLAEIISEERFDERVKALQNDGVYQAPKNAPPPPKTIKTPKKDTEGAINKANSFGQGVVEIPLNNKEEKKEIQPVENSQPNPVILKPKEEPQKDLFGDNISETIVLTEAKVIPTNYTGHKIEILGLQEPLSPNHFLFQHYKDLYIEVLKTGVYTYLTGDFSSKDLAMDKLNQVQKQFFDAKIITYKDGIRIE